MKIVWILLITLLLLGAATVIWRTQRRAIPCPFWLGWLVELENPVAKNNRSSAIIAQLELTPGMTAIDIGSGPGRVAIPLARAVGSHGKVYAVDSQPQMLQGVIKKAETIHLKQIVCIQAKVGEGKLISDLANQMDRAALINVLGEIPDKEAALQEIFTCLKPGGLLCITEVIFDPHFQSQRTVSDLTVAAGFQKYKEYGNRFAFTVCVQKPKTKID